MNRKFERCDWETSTSDCGSLINQSVDLNKAMILSENDNIFDSEGNWENENFLEVSPSYVNYSRIRNTERFYSFSDSSSKDSYCKFKSNFSKQHKGITCTENSTASSIEKSSLLSSTNSTSYFSPYISPANSVEHYQQNMSCNEYSHMIEDYSSKHNSSITDSYVGTSRLKTIPEELSTFSNMIMDDTGHYLEGIIPCLIAYGYGKKMKK